MILFLLNSRAGFGGANHVRHEIAAACERQRLEHRLLDIDDQPLEELSDALLSARIIVVVGGDGTVASVASRLGGFNGSLAVYPFGTGNDFARELGLYRLAARSSVEEYVRAITQLTPVPFQVWRAQSSTREDYFINYLSVGFDGVVISRFAEKRYEGGCLGRLGVLGNRIRYTQAGLLARGYHLPKVGLVSNTGEYASSELAGAKGVLFTNIRSIMGLGRSNLVSRSDDDRCECVAMHGLSAYLRMLGAGMIGISPPALLGSSQGWELTFDGDLPAQIDGEGATLHGPSLSILPAHLIRVLVPR